MSRKRPRQERVGECVHCGTRGPLTDDHVPPRCLFPKPRPSNLVTVPSCKECNGEASGDDEYFRWALTARNDVHDLPEVQGVSTDALRGLARPQARGFLESVFQSLIGVELRTPAGLYLGTLPGYTVDLRRLTRVVRRVITGLFYREFGSRLPDGYTTVAYAESGLTGLDEGARGQLRTWCQAAQSRPRRSIGGNVFWYWVMPLEEDPRVTVWVFIFYQKVGFIGWTGRTDLFERERQAGPPPAGGGGAPSPRA